MRPPTLLPAFACGQQGSIECRMGAHHLVSQALKGGDGQARNPVLAQDAGGAEAARRLGHKGVCAAAGGLKRPTLDRAKIVAQVQRHQHTGTGSQGMAGDRYAPTPALHMRIQ